MFYYMMKYLICLKKKNDDKDGLKIGDKIVKKSGKPFKCGLKKGTVVENIISDYKIENYLILDSQFDIYHKYLNAIDIDAKTIMHINQYRCFDEFDYKYIVDNFVNYSLEDEDA